ncbi:hypothetical protein AcV7_002843 [Taiwanofungus camphoratus]|nr:hypothetical protein AcV7_002843 [Antrodia cinnamomea]
MTSFQTTLLDSPLKSKIAGFDRFSAISSPTIFEVRRRLNEDMEGKFVKLSYDEFMTEFVPLHSRRKPPKYKEAFDRVFPQSQVKHVEDDLYRPFIDSVKEAKLCPGYKFVLTPHKADEGDESRQKVDAGLYLQKDAPKDGRPHWSRQKLWIEWKKETEQDDPLDDKGPQFEAMSLQRQKNRGQIISYAAKVFAHQHRTFFFTIMILCNHARIFRWDRSGAIVTEKFNYHQYPEKLGEFLWRFSDLSAEEQGYDPTARILSKKSREYKMMTDMAQDSPECEDYVREYFEKSLEGECTRWKLSVEEELQVTSSSSKSTTMRTRKRYFLVGKPHFLASGMAGRGTRGYVAVDTKTRKFVFLKDAWRVNLPGIDKEGEVLRVLNEHGVKYVPTLVCHGDVGEQRTITQRIWKQNYEKDKEDRNPFVNDARRNPLKAHTHYRLVTAEVGRPLSDFQDGYQLVDTIYECMKGHMQAVENAGILHRDISSGNILIIEHTDKDGKKTCSGMLNDWELSKPLSRDLNGEGEQRQPDRTGTWQFTSAMLLNHPNKAAEIQDELESFFHVLLYNGVRHLRHNCEDVGAFLYKFFDTAEVFAGIYTCGSQKLSAMRHGLVTLSNGVELRFEHDDASMNHPLNDLIHDLLMRFKAHYNVVFSDAKLATSSSSRSGAPGPQKQGKRNDKSSTAAQDMAIWRPNVDHNRAATMIAETTRTQLDQDRILANDLRSHHGMAALLGASLVTSDSWPANDKAGDLLPKEYRYKRTGGTKRDSRAMDNVELPEGSKRLRSSTPTP